MKVNIIIIFFLLFTSTYAKDKKNINDENIIKNLDFFLNMEKFEDEEMENIIDQDEFEDFPNSLESHKEKNENN